MSNMKIKIRRLLKPLQSSLLTSIVFLSFIFLTTSVTAVGKPVDVGGKPTTASGQLKQQSQTRLTEGKLRACQAKENSIKNKLTHLADLVTNMESKFDSIATRVENYYSSKVVPSGKTVPNYDALVSDIQNKKTAVQTALTVAQSNANSFNCTGNDPKGQLAQFRKDMQAVKSALKEYRTSIKNLIVAVHSVTGSTERENAGTPKPTKGRKGE